MNLRHFWAFLVLLASTSAYGAGVDLNVSDDAARLSAAFGLESNNLLFDGSWLHHQDKGDTFSLGGYLTGAAAPGPSPLQAALGLRYYYADYDGGSGESGSNLSLGGFVRYKLPQLDRVSVGADLFYAPSVLSFGDSDSLYEVGGRVGYEVIRDANVYLGWRRMKSDFDEDGDVMLDNGFHIGIRATF
jgi:hypothetical protein